MIMEITLLIMEKSWKNHGILFLNFCGNPDNKCMPGPVAQSVASPTADPGIGSSILARSHTLVEIVYEIISTFILLFLLIQKEFSVNKQKYVDEVLVNRLVKHTQEKMWLGELSAST